MIATDSDARTKWCPHARIARRELGVSGGEIIGGVNRDALSTHGGAIPASCRCIASDCMAWRLQCTVHIASPEGTQQATRQLGYCGAFGHP
ncbi:hypothetical protein BJ122_102216 [Rhodopseudomonas faecalis]|uniref:Uncharacterized protein n=1 Tax=Rhodopseudomonas faecalis TaxID=99655 RepID=A0A318TMA3_9BRAD|nr:hypothetical protein [Rhodopseudomonas faecalis]PYF04990.1 hypothetical protein BJ122_102216 [Rhodopseudomonas faecalis]